MTQGDVLKRMKEVRDRKKVSWGGCSATSGELPLATFAAHGLGCRLAHRLHVLADTEGRVLAPHNHGRFARGDKVIVPARPFPMLATVVALKKHESQCAGHFTPFALVYQPRGVKVEDSSVLCPSETAYSGKFMHISSSPPWRSCAGCASDGDVGRSYGPWGRASSGFHRAIGG